MQNIRKVPYSFSHYSSSSSLSSITKEEDQIQWTLERVIDELFLCLMYIKEDNNSIRKYEQQAKCLLYRIPIYQPPPFFVVHISDLSSKLKEELAVLEKETFDFVIKEAIGRIFEGINQRYFLLSVRSLLKWKLEE